MKPGLATLVSTAKPSLAGLIAAARGSANRRPNLNPFRGWRTVGAPPALVQAIARRIVRLADVPALDTRKGHEGEIVDGWFHFPEDLSRVLDGGWSLTRPDGVEVRFLVLVVADPEGYWVSGGVGTVRHTGATVIGVYVPTRKAYDDALWMEELERFLAHELAHLADPGRKRSRAVPTSTMAEVWKPATEAEWDAYVNDPREVVARRHEVWHELSVKRNLHDAVRRWTTTTDWPRGRIVRNALNMSETWRDIEKRLTPKNRRAIQKMAAQLVERWIDGAAT